MTDDARSDDEQALMHLLSDPSVWADTSDVSEDAIVAAIRSEAGTIAEPASGLSGLVESSSVNDHVVPISAARRWVAPLAAGIAAALLIVVGLAAAFRFADDSSGIELTLAGTELAPEATATASFDDTPIGTRIILDVSGLRPAAPGTYYEAWMRVDGETGVSAGTFHFRGGDGEIELWSAVPLDDYPLFTITIQDEAVPTSSGVVVLKGLLGQN